MGDSSGEVERPNNLLLEKDAQIAALMTRWTLRRGRARFACSPGTGVRVQELPSDQRIDARPAPEKPRTSCGVLAGISDLRLFQ
jgi:hypothetical protein